MFRLFKAYIIAKIEHNVQNDNKNIQSDKYKILIEW